MPRARGPAGALLLALVVACGAARGDAPPGDPACVRAAVCVQTLDPSWLPGTPCEGRTAQWFDRRPGTVALVQCGGAGPAEEPLVLVLDRRQPQGDWVLLEGARAVRTLQGLSPQALPDAFATRPLCPAARAVFDGRPDRRTGQLVLLQKVPADTARPGDAPYCFHLLLARGAERGAAVRGGSGQALPVMAADERGPWQGLVQRAAAARR